MRLGSRRPEPVQGGCHNDLSADLAVRPSKWNRGHATGDKVPSNGHTPKEREQELYMKSSGKRAREDENWRTAQATQDHTLARCALSLRATTALRCVR
eukprot:1156772-Pelagomonas_calceolata.AAC.8